MALFQIFKGDEAELMTKKLHAGYAYFCEDTGKLFIDIADGVDGTETDLYRIPLNSKAANGLLVDDEYVEADSFATLEDVSDATSQAITTTLLANGWVADNDVFTYNYVNTNLKCGQDGTIPPIITPIANEKEYSNIISATATPGSGIIFTAVIQPEDAIEITIIDIC